MTPPSEREVWVHADGHTHIYPAHALDRFLAVGLRRADRLGGPLLLLLTESSGFDYFGSLRTLAHGDRAQRESRAPGIDGAMLRESALSLHPTEEAGSLAVRRHGRSSPGLFLIAGRQFNSVERLEVQAIGLDPDRDENRIRDHEHPAESLLKKILAAGAAAVLPWGVGKWLGARGREIERLLNVRDLVEDPLFFLGDIAARCWPWPAPAGFRSGPRVLRGTDLLPLTGAERRLATYGFKVFGRFDAGSPGRSLLDLLRSGSAIESVGRRQSPLTMLIDQLRYRMRR